MGRKIPEFLTEDEQKLLLRVFNTRYFNSVKNKTLIQLDLNTGLRLQELIDLKWKDINLMTGQLKVVQGKGHKDRMLWLSESTLETLREWRIKQTDNLGECEYVFTTNTKKQLDNKNVRKMVTDYSIKAGITKNVTPHTLRHTYATDLLRSTKNIRLVQKALGHSDISTTMIYTHIIDDEFEDALKNFRK
ncbi:integrase [Clostridium botulinum]|nr:integrase [Clostridium botulinum]NFM10362.1 integrase [Clostridium botulinum]NFO73237.1 integrase [Clostridium botulinum]